jgi:hypothetical protein
VPVNTFNKVWIVPVEAKVYVRDNTIIIAKARLKVMLEEDNNGNTEKASGNISVHY